jgi:hypothetical protein
MCLSCGRQSHVTTDRQSVCLRVELHLGPDCGWPDMFPFTCCMCENAAIWWSQVDRKVSNSGLFVSMLVSFILCLTTVAYDRDMYIVIV